MVVAAYASIAVRFVELEDLISCRHSAGASVSVLFKGHVFSLVCNYSGPRNHTGLSLSSDACASFDSRIARRHVVYIKTV